VSQRGVVFFRDQELTIDEQKLLGTKLGELTGKPASSKLHIHPTTAESSELGDEISVITPERNRGYLQSTDKSTFAA
jgi:alpha-ketoglutarate-dependent taurine dioxygenase